MDFVAIRSSRVKPASWRRRWWDSTTRRCTASSSAYVCSATDSALPPAWLTTAMPAAVQAATSMVS